MLPTLRGEVTVHIWPSKTGGRKGQEPPWMEISNDTRKKNVMMSFGPGSDESLTREKGQKKRDHRLLGNSVT